MHFTEYPMRRIGVVIVAVCAVHGIVDAEEHLHVKSYSSVYGLYEPIILQVSLELDGPLVLDGREPAQTAIQLRRLRRRFEAALVQDETVVHEFPLTSPQYEGQDASDGKLCAQLIGFPGNTDERGEGFTHFDEPGIYEIVVREIEHGVKAQPVTVRLRGPVADETAAARLFRESFPGAILAILAHKADVATEKRFQELAERYPDTAYGKYAVTSLAQIQFARTVAEHNHEGGATVWEPVVATLTSARSVFGVGHPVRAELLFSLARAQLFAGQKSDARRTAETLSSEFPEVRLGRMARALLNELDE